MNYEFTAPTDHAMRSHVAALLDIACELTDLENESEYIVDHASLLKSREKYQSLNVDFAATCREIYGALHNVHGGIENEVMRLETYFLLAAEVRDESWRAPARYALENLIVFVRRQERARKWRRALVWSLGLVATALIVGCFVF